MSLEKAYSVDIKRPLAHAGILIDRKAWEEAHNFHLNRLSLHAMTMHKAGIVEGLEVFAESLCRSVLVNTKTVVDDDGEESTLVPSPREVPLYKLESKAVAITPDGSKAVAGLGDGTIRVWNLESNSEERTINAHESAISGIVITPDGGRVVSGSEDGSVRIWNLESGDRERNLETEHVAVHCLAITPIGSNIVGGLQDGSIHIWNFRTGERERVLSGHGSAVLSIVVTPDGAHLISGSNDNSVRVWDFDSGNEQKILTGHRGGVRGVASSLDGRYVVTSSNDSSVRVWDISSDSEEPLNILEGHTAPVTGIAITLDGKQVVSASEDRSLRVWNMESGQLDQELTGHNRAVNCISVIPHSDYMLSGSEDGTMRVWDLKAGSLVYFNAGIAIDGRGTVVSVTEPDSVPLDRLRGPDGEVSPDGIAYVLLSNYEMDSEEPEMVVTHRNERLPRYKVRKYDVDVYSSPPDENQVELARIQLDGQNLKVQDAENRYDPAENEIDLRFRYSAGAPPLGEIVIGVLTLAMSEDDDVSDHIYGVSKLVQAIGNLTPYKAYLKRLDELDERSLDECHLVIMAGQRAFENSLDDTHQQLLEAFLDRGGTLLGENCSSREKGDEGFTRDFSAFASRRLRHRVIAGMDPGNELLNSYFTFSEIPEGIVPEPNGIVNISSDLAVIQSTRDYGCAWGGQISSFQRDFIRTTTEFGVNLAVYSFNRVQQKKARKDLGLVV